MNDSNTAMDQHFNARGFGGSTYVALDGILKFCITAPLLELPIDFKEWYKPQRSNTPNLIKAGSFQNARPKTD